MNWKSQRAVQWYDKVRQAEFMPTREYNRVVEQMEMESITGPVDDKAAFIRHKEAMARRAFAWYRLSKLKDKGKLIDIYNGCALLGKRNGR